MQQTPTFHLSQWDPADRIQREDFNADNLKIENALADLNKRAGCVIVHESNVRTNSSWIYSFYPSFRWEQYSMIHILFYPVTYDNAPVDFAISTKPDEKTVFASMPGNSSPDNIIHRAHFTLLPMFDRMRKISLIATGTNPAGFISLDATYDDLEDLLCYRTENSPIAPGSSSKTLAQC